MIMSYGKLRRDIFEVIDHSNGKNKIGLLYDTVMILFILMSLVPLLFREPKPVFGVIERVTTTVFIIDYLLRWMTCDLKLNMPGLKAFVVYPFTGLAIIDLLSILPGLNILSSSFKMLRIIRMLKIMRIFRLFRYSTQIQLLFLVLDKERKVLMAVLFMAIFYILITALVIFNLGTEEDIKLFPSFFDAVYWATMTLTTVGYGDVYPVSTIARIISMISSLFGIAIIALPSGIITATYMESIREHRKQKGDDVLPIDKIDDKNDL